MKLLLPVVLLCLSLADVRPQLVCYQCTDCEYQQEIAVVCGETNYPTPPVTTPELTTCPTCAPTWPTTPELTTATPTPPPCPTCAPEPSLPTTHELTTSTPIYPTLPTTPEPTTYVPTDTTCPTCAPQPTTPELTTPSPYPTLPTSPEPTCPTCGTWPETTYTVPMPTLPTTHELTTSTPTVPSSTTPSCPPGCCPCGAKATSVFALAAKAAKEALDPEPSRDARHLPLPVYVCYSTEVYVNNRRVINRGCTKRQQNLSDTCGTVTNGYPYEQCSLCSWQLCNR